MERILTIEDFRAWGRAGGKARIANQGPEKVQAQAIKANRASVKARRRLAKQKAKPVDNS
jgi:hypothetical protein